jgi:cation diffusion facilitator CzcD-associated flavoprotein CzcO
MSCHPQRRIKVLSFPSFHSSTDHVGLYDKRIPLKSPKSVGSSSFSLPQTCKNCRLMGGKTPYFRHTNHQSESIPLQRGYLHPLLRAGGFRSTLGPDVVTPRCCNCFANILGTEGPVGTWTTVPELFQDKQTIRLLFPVWKQPEHNFAHGDKR